MHSQNIAGYQTISLKEPEEIHSKNESENDVNKIEFFEAISPLSETLHKDESVKIKKQKFTVDLKSAKIKNLNVIYLTPRYEVQKEMSCSINFENRSFENENPKLDSFQLDQEIKPFFASNKRRNYEKNKKLSTSKDETINEVPKTEECVNKTEKGFDKTDPISSNILISEDVFEVTQAIPIVTLRKGRKTVDQKITKRSMKNLKNLSITNSKSQTRITSDSFHAFEQGPTLDSNPKSFRNFR